MLVELAATLCVMTFSPPYGDLVFHDCPWVKPVACRFGRQSDRGTGIMAACYDKFGNLVYFRKVYKLGPVV